MSARKIRKRELDATLDTSTLALYRHTRATWTAGPRTQHDPQPNPRETTDTVCLLCTTGIDEASIYLAPRLLHLVSRESMNPRALSGHVHESARAGTRAAQGSFTFVLTRCSAWRAPHTRGGLRRGTGREMQYIYTKMCRSVHTQKGKNPEIRRGDTKARYWQIYRIDASHTVCGLCAVRVCTSTTPYVH